MRRAEKRRGALTGADGVFTHADVTDSRSVGDAVAQVTERLGAVSILVNCGGDVAKPFLETDEELWYLYSGAEGGGIAFTKTIAREMARKGMTANAVCPGPTETTRSKKRPPARWRSTSPL